MPVVEEDRVGGANASLKAGFFIIAFAAASCRE